MNPDFIQTKIQETSLEELLNEYTKPQLVELGDNVNGTIRKSWKKDKMVKHLSRQILEQAQTFFKQMLEDILSQIPVQETQLYRLNDLKDVETFTPLIKKGFFFISEHEEEYYFVIPDEIQESVDVSEDLKVEDNSIRNKQIIEWKERLLTIYGNYSLKHIQKVWNNYYETQLSLEELENILS